ncbi:hypothetical protein LCGC14_1973930 [marine sediment metagenome]|uniref:Uncharacterized protein n=1 Tax=marine sediment metagenome TaxID=412755 RepID=A0A0F9HPA3_9ZZZZ
MNELQTLKRYIKEQEEKIEQLEKENCSLKAIYKRLLIRLGRIKESTEQSINYIQDSVDEMQQIL